MKLTDLNISFKVEESKLDTGNLADSRTIDDLKNEVENLNSVISELKTRIQNAESTVRKEFDDILQNLREDLQTSLKENSLLQAELFMLKNMQGNEIGNQRKSEKVLKIESQTQTDIESRDTQLSIENKQRSEGKSLLGVGQRSWGPPERIFLVGTSL